MKEGQRVINLKIGICGLSREIHFFFHQHEKQSWSINQHGYESQVLSLPLNDAKRTKLRLHSHVHRYFFLLNMFLSLCFGLSFSILDESILDETVFWINKKDFHNLGEDFQKRSICVDVWQTTTEIFFLTKSEACTCISILSCQTLHHTPWLGAFEWLIFFSLFVFYHHLLLAVLMAALHSDDDDDAPNPLVSKPFQVSTATLLRINKPVRQPFLIFVTYSHHYFWMPFLGICPGRKLLPFPCQAFP